MLTANPKHAGERKEMLPAEKFKATNLITLWNFEGFLKYSPIFYGYYTNKDDTRSGYRLPFAYFMTGLAVYIYSFVATLKRCSSLCCSLFSIGRGHKSNLSKERSDFIFLVIVS
jgi:hypothetical protein